MVKSSRVGSFFSDSLLAVLSGIRLDVTVGRTLRLRFSWMKTRCQDTPSTNKERSCNSFTAWSNWNRTNIGRELLGLNRAGLRLRHRWTLCGINSVKTKKWEVVSKIATASNVLSGCWLVWWKTESIFKEMTGTLYVFPRSALSASGPLAAFCWLRAPLLSAKGLYASGNFFWASFQRFL